MGGYGSGWARRRKTLVEDCLTLHVKTIRPSLTPGYCGWVKWGNGNLINYRVIGDPPQAVRLSYTITRAGEKTDFNYPVRLDYDVTPWGSRRAWFICPLVIDGLPCARRVGALYSPPGADYFGCRHCYNLTYKSAQEAHKFDSLWRLMAQGSGYTPADMRYLMTDFLERPKLPPLGGRLAAELAARLRALADLAANPPDPYPDYLSAGDLCELAGLTPGDLDRLGAARLLNPDTKDGRYRPKLAGWGRKLGELLRAGWEIDELRAWARGRWHTANPRAWPPDRAAWRR